MLCVYVRCQFAILRPCPCTDGFRRLTCASGTGVCYGKRRSSATQGYTQAEARRRVRGCGISKYCVCFREASAPSQGQVSGAHTAGQARAVTVPWPLARSRPTSMLSPSASFLEHASSGRVLPLLSFAFLIHIQLESCSCMPRYRFRLPQSH